MHGIQAHFITSPKIIILKVFWELQRVYMKEFLEAGKNGNSAQYIEIIKILRQGV